jgi:putative Mn2+ efflux pump MntP
MKKTSNFQNGLIWFGAGVSLAEILTGTAFAPLGMAKGFAAILLGHIIGCAMMLLAGLIGGRPQRYGDRKNELRPEGRPAVCVPERFAARRLDGHHDL